MVRMKVTPRVDLKRVPLLGVSSGSTPPLTRELEEEEAIGGAGDCREVTGILPNPDVSQDDSRGGAFKDQQR